VEEVSPRLQLKISLLALMHKLLSCTDYKHVFDFQWAHASENQLGFPYLFQDVSMIYPKMEY
jgi:hypothetical protein